MSVKALNMPTRILQKRSSWSIKMEPKFSKIYFMQVKVEINSSSVFIKSVR